MSDSHAFIMNEINYFGLVIRPDRDKVTNHAMASVEAPNTQSHANEAYILQWIELRLLPPHFKFFS